MVRVIKLLIALIMLCVLGYFWAPARLLTLKLAGLAPGCPLIQTIGSHDYFQSVRETAREIAKGSRIIATDSGCHLWQTPHGRFWAPVGGGAALQWNLAEQQMQIYGGPERGVRAGDVVLDCGANVGVYTGVALSAGARLVVVIEPAPENLECLRRNFAPQIEDRRVIVYPKGVWDRDEMLAINRDPRNPAADSFVVKRAGMKQGPVLPLTTIDKLVSELHLARVDFIKMDIEGAEAKALAGGRATLAKYHPRMALAAHHRPDDTNTLPALARRAWPGYRIECGSCADYGSFVQPVSIYLY
jgi:FkbM family methyltransferase